MSEKWTLEVKNGKTWKYGCVPINSQFPRNLDTAPAWFLFQEDGGEWIFVDWFDSSQEMHKDINTLASA